MYFKPKYCSGIYKKNNFRNKKRKRFRGRKGGLRERLKRRGSRVPLPNIVFGNVRSLRNKIDELDALTKFNTIYRNYSLIILIETWLSNHDDDGLYKLNGFNFIRGDRTIESGKATGGGVCAYINQSWCNNFSIHTKFCSKFIEILILNLRPFYLPREFNKVYVIVVYIPPDSNYRNARDNLLEYINLLENESPEAVKIILGDFNKSDIRGFISSYVQCVKCSTRGNAILDLLYCNVKDSYVVKQLSCLGQSDHNMLHCIPSYKQKFKKFKPIVKTIYKWNPAFYEKIRDCFEKTKWEVLFDVNSDINFNTAVFTAYFNFCVDVCLEKQEAVVYPNNKPWVTREVLNFFK